jgi:hypothetical protein
VYKSVKSAMPVPDRFENLQQASIRHLQNGYDRRFPPRLFGGMYRKISVSTMLIRVADMQRRCLGNVRLAGLP